MAVRRLYEPLCIAFGTTVSSPTVPTYQLYDLPHKFTPRLYMESEDPNLVLREIGVWAGWEQAGAHAVWHPPQGGDPCPNPLGAPWRLLGKTSKRTPAALPSAFCRTPRGHGTSRSSTSTGSAA